MSVKGCFEYVMERRDTQRAIRAERASRQLELDRVLDELAFKRELEDGDYEMKGVNLTERNRESLDKSAQASRNRNRFGCTY